MTKTVRVGTSRTLDVVASIDRLDKFRYPWVWLFIGDKTEDASVDCLTVMGGEGVYWLALSAGKYDQLRLFDPNKDSQAITVWTSDQGLQMKWCM